mgnify:CR=1 FL=1
MAAHDLHDAAALVRLHRIAQTVDALDGGVGGGIEADGIVGADDVVVDRAGNAHAGHAELAQLQRTVIGTVASDDDNAFNPHFPDVAHGVSAAFRGEGIRRHRAVRRLRAG